MLFLGLSSSVLGFSGFCGDFFGGSMQGPRNT